MSNELTNIEIIVFEDEQGNQVEMEIVDEFDFENNHYIALVQLPDAEGEIDEEPPIQFYQVEEEGDEELFDYIEDKSLIKQLENALEERLFQK